MNINFGFINPEELKAQQERQKAEIQKMIDEKCCIYCENAVLINDQVAICNAKGCENLGQCVDDKTGKECQFWILLKNIY